MLRIIHASSMGGSGCLLTDFASSSLDDSTGEAETEFDCSVRYLCELDAATTAAAFINGVDEEANCEIKIAEQATKSTMTGDQGRAGLPDSIELANGSGQFEQILESNPTRRGQITVDAAIEKIGFGKFQMKLMLIVGLCWMADGSEMMLLSILGPTLKCVWHLSSFKEAFITTSVFLGLMIGCAFCGWASDRYGRKKVIILSSFAVLYFGILSSQSPSYYWILVIRMFVGLGIGGVPQAVTLVAELLPSSSRGRSIILLQLFWAVGSVFAVVMALAAVNSIGWRWYLILSALPALAFLLFSKWLPESPRYLFTAGKKEEAMDVLRRIAKENGRPMPCENIGVTEIAVSRGKLMDLFGKEYRMSTCLLWMIWFTSVFAYYGIVLLSTEMFQTHIDSCNPQGLGVKKAACGCFLLSSKDYTDFLWTTVSEFPAILLTLPIIEYLGRKKTLALEFFAGSIFFLLLLICSNRTANVVLIFCARACITGAFQAAYVYTPELFPTNVRSLGLGSCTSFARIGAMSTPFVAQVLLHSSFYDVIAVYVFMLVSCSIASMLLPIETKGRALEDTTSLSVSYKKTGYDRLR